MIGTQGAKQMIGESENLFYAHKVMVLCTQMHPFDDQQAWVSKVKACELHPQSIAFGFKVHEKQWHKNHDIHNHLYQNNLRNARIQAVFATTEKIVGKYAKYEEVRCQENSSLLRIVVSTYNLSDPFVHTVDKTGRLGVTKVKQESRTTCRAFRTGTARAARTSSPDR